jgi:Calcium-binding EGF domain/EGF domain
MLVAGSRRTWHDALAFALSSCFWMSCVGLPWLVVSACNVDSSVGPQTQVVVDIDAEPRVRLRSAQLQLFIVGARARDSADVPSLQRQLTLGHDGAPNWPLRLVLVPKNGDASRMFTVTATALDANDSFVAAVRLMSGYVRDQIRYAKLVLETDCIDVQCALGESCSAGACVSAYREPATLALFWPTADAGTADAAVARDAATDDDAGPDDFAQDAIGTSLRTILDRCARDRGGCDPLVTCQSIAELVVCGACPAGYLDVHGDGTQCSDIDECAHDNGGCDAQHGQCTNTPGDRACRCTGGYHGDGTRCTANALCDDASGCGKQATCRAGGCVCNAGYHGDGTQCDDIDECAQASDACRANATCMNSAGSFTCPCNPGYVDMAGACVDLDECAANSDGCDDSPDACSNTPGAFVCACPSGYSGDGTGADGCSDIDECAADSDDCSDTPNACSNTPGAFVCKCPTGYSGNGKGKTGCVDLDECASNNGDCGKHRSCKNTPGSHECGDCDSGYRKNEGGECVSKDG